jgi:AAA+ ATPase superfamily predicted ATPase
LTKETPVGEKSDRKSIYKITDNYFKFWYRFVFNNIELVEQNDGEILYDQFIEPFLSDYIGRNVFEDICKEYLRKQNAKRALPFVFTKIGRWWGASVKEKKPVEIDLIALHNNDVILAECKWRNEIFDAKDMRNFFAKAKNFSEYANNTFFFFAKAGFSQDVQNAAKDAKNIVLINLEKLFSPLA